MDQGVINFVLLLAITAGIAINAKSRIRRREYGIALGYILGILYFTVAPIWVLFLFGSIQGINKTNIPSVSWNDDAEPVFTLLSMLAVAIVCLTLIRDTKWRDITTTAPSIRFLKLWQIFTAYLSLVAIEFLALGLGSANSHWAESRTDLMQETGAAGILLLIITRGVKYAALLLILERFLVRPKSNFYSLGLLILADLYTTGTRIAVAQSALAVVVKHLIDRKFRRVLIVAILFAPVIYAMLLFTTMRSFMHRWKDYSITGAIQAIDNSFDYAQRYNSRKMDFPYAVARITEASSINVFIATERIFPSHEPYLRGATLIKPFVFWVPRAIWENKPLNFPTIIGSKLVRHGVSLNSTAFGEPYANFGVLGVLYMPLLVIVLIRLQVITELFLQLGRLNSLIGLIVGFTITRNGIIETVFPFVLAILICSFAKRETPQQIGDEASGPWQHNI